MKLSSQERMGTEWNEYPTPKYRIVEGANAPTYIELSVRLINRHDDHPGSDFDTNEDQFVERTIRGVIWLLITVGAAAVTILLMTGAVKNLALGIVAVLVLSMLVRVVVMMTISPETLVDWLASRLFGAPARPRLYIQQGIERGLVEIDSK